MKNTLIINVLGGPGVGKTTIASDLFVRFKRKELDVEIVSEFAKELVWEKRNEAFDDRLYMHAEQNHRLMMMNGNLDYIITDSPLILTSVYNHFYLENKHTKEYNKMIDDVTLQTFNSYNNITFLIERETGYDTNGRRESLDEAKAIDERIIKYLEDNNIQYIKINDRVNAADEIIKYLNI